MKEKDKDTIQKESPRSSHPINRHILHRQRVFCFIDPLESENKRRQEVFDRGHGYEVAIDREKFSNK